MSALAKLGRADEALALATKLLSDPALAEDRVDQADIRCAQALIAAQRGELSREGLAELVEQAVNCRYQTPGRPPTTCRAFPRSCGFALAAGEPDLAARLAEGLEPVYPLDQPAAVTARALLAEQRGEQAEAAGLFVNAAARWKQFEMPWERAQALLGQGRCLLALGRPAQAIEPLQNSREIFTSLGASPASIETDGLLAQATTLTA